MFNREVKPFDPKSKGLAAIKVPLRPISDFNRIGEEDEVISVPIVFIYNAKELASEIAKCLKNGTSNCGERNTNSDNPPK